MKKLTQEMVAEKLNEAKALSQRGDKGEAKARLYEILFQQPDHRKALQALLMIIDSNAVEQGLREVQMTFLRGEKELAYLQAQQLAEKYPHGYRIPFTQGGIQYEQGNFEQAIAHYRHAIDLKVDFIDAYNAMESTVGYDPTLCSIYINAKEPLLQAVQLQSNTAGFYYHLGNIYRFEENVEEALNAYKQAHLLNPKHLLTMQKIDELNALLRFED